MSINRLTVIASTLIPFQREYDSKFSFWMDNLGSIDDPMAYLTEAAEDFNKEVEKYVDEIAELTGNSIHTIRSTCRPKNKDDLWFHPSCAYYLADVAKYRSFNEDYISKMKARENEAS